MALLRFRKDRISFMAIDRKGNVLVTVIVPTRNNEQEIARFLRALAASTAAQEMEIVVTDMGSVDGTEKAVRSFREKAAFGVRFFQTGGNTGRCHALNCGLHLVTTPFAAVVPPEAEVGKHCIERLCAALEERPDVFCAEAAMRGGREENRPCLGQSGRTVRVYRMAALEETGPFDERLYRGLEEEDLEMRGALCGYQAVFVKDAYARVPERDIVSGTNILAEASVEVGNLMYLLYKNLPSAQQSLNQVALRAALKRFKTFFALKDREDLYEAALERGQDLCMDAEMCIMREEEGLPAVVLPLPETFCLAVKDLRVEEIDPLYLGKREVFSVRDIPVCVRVQGVLWRKVFGAVNR